MYRMLPSSCIFECGYSDRITAPCTRAVHMMTWTTRKATKRPTAAHLLNPLPLTPLPLQQQQQGAQAPSCAAAAALCFGTSQGPWPGAACAAALRRVGLGLWAAAATAGLLEACIMRMVVARVALRCLQRQLGAGMQHHSPWHTFVITQSPGKPSLGS